MKPDKAPKLTQKQFCVVDRENQELAGLVSAFFTEKNAYLPMFVFPKLGAGDNEVNEFEDDDFISKMMGRELGILMRNALAKGGIWKNVIYIGLDDAQKSYLSLPPNINVIEINKADEIESKLSVLVEVGKNELRCKRSDLLLAIYQAKIQNKKVTIDESADLLKNKDFFSKGGLVLVEDDGFAPSLLAINYAFSVGANLRVVQGVSSKFAKRVPKLIELWKENNDLISFDEVQSEIVKRMEGTFMERYPFVTFFTIGLPYSLFIKNIIPNSYVHLELRADLFILNAIIYESLKKFHSAVLFSPENFEIEEIDSIHHILVSNNYLVKLLKGDDATVRNLDFFLQHYPFDIFHICTHGGEVTGSHIVDEYTDRTGVKHTVEYDLVVGFAPVPGKDLIGVHEKKIFTLFDGLPWMSDEIAALKLPRYVFEDLRKAIFHNDSPGSPIKITHGIKITNSCSISCIDSVHQGDLHILASHSSPLIFNNSCWSWGDVSRFFIAGGARAYIGTLWAIDSLVAVNAANVFYQSLIGDTILSAFHKANKVTLGTDSEDIYILWGLHFSSITTSSNLASSRKRVFAELIRAFRLWRRSSKVHTSDEIRKNATNVADDIHSLLVSDFNPDDFFKHLVPSLKERIYEHFTKRSNK